LNEIPFDFHELIGALAPRHLFVNAPLGDTNFKWRSVEAIARAAKPVFELYHVPRNLRVEHPDCGHLFPPEMREMAYKLFDENLMRTTSGTQYLRPNIPDRRMPSFPR